MACGRGQIVHIAKVILMVEEFVLWKQTRDRRRFKKEARRERRGLPPIKDPRTFARAYEARMSGAAKTAERRLKKDTRRERRGLPSIEVERAFSVRRDQIP